MRGLIATVLQPSRGVRLQVLQVDSHGPLILQLKGGCKISLGVAHKGVEILYILYWTYLRLERDEEL